MIATTTIKFLRDLKNNNNKEWFDANRDRYKLAKTNMEEVTQSLIDQLSKIDKSIEETTVKQSIFRIFRDVRFSKDKRPYKINMGAFVVGGGRKSGKAGYYLHIEPGNCFLGAGIYMPPGPMLAKVRQEIDYNQKEFKKIMGSKRFKDIWGDLWREDTLKTAPKGYPKDHPAIEILRLKSYIASKKLNNKEVQSQDFIKNAVKDYKAALPLIAFINRSFD